MEWIHAVMLYAIRKLQVYIVNIKNNDDDVSWLQKARSGNELRPGHVALAMTNCQRTKRLTNRCQES